MTQALESLAEIADRYDAIVFDQWGVLHNGRTAYPTARAAIDALGDKPLAVLSNSGKRSAPNAQRIGAMGFDMAAFTQVMSSGEALYQDLAGNTIPHRRFLPVETARGDAATFARGLDIAFTDLRDAEALLLMGLPDHATLDAWRPKLEAALPRPAYCSNPDHASPRGDETVISVGLLASAYAEMGGKVTFYGKPHLPIFTALQKNLGTDNILMVGDSLAHDITGAATAGWDSLFLTGGLYHTRFNGADWRAPLAALMDETASPAPTYIMDVLK